MGEKASYAAAAQGNEVRLYSEVCLSALYRVKPAESALE